MWKLGGCVPSPGDGAPDPASLGSLALGLLPCTEHSDGAASPGSLGVDSSTEQRERGASPQMAVGCLPCPPLPGVAPGLPLGTSALCGSVLLTPDPGAG